MAQVPLAGDKGAIARRLQTLRNREHAGFEMHRIAAMAFLRGGSTSGMVATPVRWLSTPVSSIARDGAHNGEV